MKLNFNPIADNRLAYFPKNYANQAILFYFVALAACTILFMKVAIPIAMGIVSMLLFFNGSNALGKRWSCISEKSFIKNVVMYYVFKFKFGGKVSSYGTSYIVAPAAIFTCMGIVRFLPTNSRLTRGLCYMGEHSLAIYLLSNYFLLSMPGLADWWVRQDDITSVVV